MFWRRRIVLAAVFLGILLTPAGAAEAGFVPPLDRVGTDEGEVYWKGCMAGDAQVHSRKCVFGDPGSKRRVVLLGDSHAAHWGGALNRLGKRRGWKVIVLTRASCPAALASVDKYCDIWRRNVFKRIKRMKPGLVLVGSAANRQAYSVLRYGHKLSRQASERRLVAGMVRTFRFLKRWAGETVLIRDQSVAPFDVTTCLRKNWRHARRCGFRPTRTMTRSYDYKAARRFGVRVIDPQQLLCPNRFCRPLDGRFQIYRNDSHFAATFTRRQYRWLGRKIGNPWPEIKKRQKRRQEDSNSGFPEPLGRTMWPGAAGILGG